MQHNLIFSRLAVLSLALGAVACSDSPTSTGTNMSTETPAILQPTAGADQSAAPGAKVAVAPAVVVKTSQGTPIAGQTVRFTVKAGGGSVANATTVTNADGAASAGTWTLGSEGTNVVEATVGGLAVQFTALATSTPVVPVVTSPFTIEIRYLAPATARQQQAVSNAVARWQTVITRDLANIPVNAPRDACFEGQPAMNERVDDIVIFVELVYIDGVGKVLGEAGPCYVRNDNKLPVVGHLKLDASDLVQMESYGTLDDVVLHEIGHVLGIGTMWPDKGLLQGQGLEDPNFMGARAISEYRTMGGAALGVPVENTGGEGTRDGHWRESVFGKELMTGYISSAGNPLSALTISSLIDLGYGADAGAASSYALGARSTGGVVMEIGRREIMKRPRFTIDTRGRKYPIE